MERTWAASAHRAKIDAELELVAEAGATIVHCPMVSLRHGSYLDSFTRLRKMGVNIGLGTDTWPADIIQNMHIGVMATRMADRSMDVRASDYYTAATIGERTRSDEATSGD
ncbi:MAG: amidohydrolase family protein [Thermomicrobiales bacterium]